MSDVDENKLDPGLIAALYVEHGEQLQRFLVGVVRDHQLARDVVQSTFAKLMEQGHQTRVESRKAWLFRVAYNEALAIRRREAVSDRAVRRLARTRPSENGSADEPLVRLEAVHAVKEAIEQLPIEQQRVVRMRIYEEKTFAQIAEELQIPLGTALGRMRAALAKLRQRLDTGHTQHGR